MRRKGKMIDKEVKSEYLNESIIIKWYQPEAFTPMHNFHLCIMQDGDDYFRMGRIATLSDALHDDGEIDTTVFVGIHYKDRFDRKSKYHPDGSKHSSYMHFLIHEVLPMLDRELHVKLNAISIGLIGDSLAGTLALMTAITYPDIFSKIIIQSPYVDKKVLNAVYNAGSLEPFDIYHTIGKKETAVPTTGDGTQNFLTPNRELMQLLQLSGANYYYQEQDGDHTWGNWQQDLPRALTTIYG